MHTVDTVVACLSALALVMALFAHGLRLRWINAPMVALLLGVRSDEQQHLHGLVAELTSGTAGLVPGRERWVDRR